MIQINFDILYHSLKEAFGTFFKIINRYIEDNNRKGWNYFHLSAIISSGLIPPGKNTYWMYYYATNMVHSHYDQSGRKFKYYRIKMRIKEFKVQAIKK